MDTEILRVEQTQRKNCPEPGFEKVLKNRHFFISYNCVNDLCTDLRTLVLIVAHLESIGAWIFEFKHE